MGLYLVRDKNPCDAKANVVFLAISLVKFEFDTGKYNNVY
jgi:hypothetical protein